MLCQISVFQHNYESCWCPEEGSMPYQGPWSECNHCNNNMLATHKHNTSALFGYTQRYQICLKLRTKLIGQSLQIIAVKSPALYPQPQYPHFVYPLLMHSRAIAWALEMSALVIRPARSSLHLPALSSPFAAARLYHMCAMTLS